MRYILGIDQSTQGTKAILVDEYGKIIGRADRSHKQKINAKGWVSHDLDEIYENVQLAVKAVVEKTGILKSDIQAIGISNQRETTAIWNKEGKPLNDAVVWQCSRAKDIAEELKDYAGIVRKTTGIPLSPYFPASKMTWLLRNTEYKEKEQICLGTIDSFLIYKLTHGECFKTDYSNASRTQLFDIHELKWSEEICKIFGIPMECLPQVCDSDSNFGNTDLEGYLDEPIPIHGVVGDSHAALFGQGCHEAGMIKTTYGTGSSIMMNTGDQCVTSRHGLVTSLAWKSEGEVNYVLEGNINYTGAVITWLKDDLKLITDPGETEQAARNANPEDQTIFVPAFSGLSMPYWKNNAKALICGMTRVTGKNEIIKAALDSIALQIEAVLEAMRKDSGIQIGELRVDGGPTKNKYLMQLQSDLSDLNVAIASVEELSALGAAYMAGIGGGICQKEELFEQQKRRYFKPQMDKKVRQEKISRWSHAVEMA